MTIVKINDNYDHDNSSSSCGNNDYDNDSTSNNDNNDNKLKSIGAQFSWVSREGVIEWGKNVNERDWVRRWLRQSFGQCANKQHVKIFKIYSLVFMLWLKGCSSVMWLVLLVFRY